MSFADFLTDRVTIERAVKTEYGDGSQQETLADHLTLVPCRYVQQQERVAGPNGLMMVTVTKLLLTGGDVTSADKVRQIVRDDGSVLGTHTIEAVIPRIAGRGNHHIELQIEKVA